MATPGEWLAGARPRTLPAAVAPVAAGSGAAAAVDGFCLSHALLAGLGCREVITTAYDRCYERAVASQGLAQSTVVLPWQPPQR